MIAANNPKNTSWITYSKDHHFPIQNIPFGACTIQNNTEICSRIGDTVIRLNMLHSLGFFQGIALPEKCFSGHTLNVFLKESKPVWRAVRNRISELFSSGNSELQEHPSKAECMVDIASVRMEMPISVGDYTDFYSSRQHAYNVGCMFRDPDNALMPNWLRLPVGYHGRSSSIVLSGTPLKRPMGQKKAKDATDPTFGPSARLDFELEMAFVTGQGKPLGERITTEEAKDYIFGMCIFNDWSARDIQAWEYVPLGPFLGKNFGSSISPWIITLDALEPFRVDGEVQEPAVLPYLETTGKQNIDIQLEVGLKSPTMNSYHTLSTSNYKYMYWNMSQQLAHHSVNGCNVRAGDMMASGTISGAEEHEYGSMLELSWAGSKSITLPNGEERKFIEDNDSVKMTAFCKAEHYTIGFGEVEGTILPAEK